MQRNPKSFWTSHRLLVAAFAAALALTLFLAIRTVAFYVYWQNHRDVALEGWMTLGYVAHSYQIEPQSLRVTLGMPVDGPDRRTIARIAEDTGIPLDRFMAQLARAIDDLRAEPGNVEPRP